MICLCKRQTKTAAELWKVRASTLYGRSTSGAIRDVFLEEEDLSQALRSKPQFWEREVGHILDRGVTRVEVVRRKWREREIRRG